MTKKIGFKGVKLVCYILLKKLFIIQIFTLSRLTLSKVFVKKTYALKNYYFDIRYQILFKIPSLIFKDKIRYHNCPSQKNENKNE